MDVRMKLAIESIGEADPIPAICVPPDMQLGDAYAALEQNNGGLLVCHQGMLVGIFTERDALKALAAETPNNTPIGTLMTVSPVTARTSTSMAAAVRKMAVGGYRRLPVLDEHNRPVGVVTTSGLVHYLVEQFARTIYNLPPTSAGTFTDRDGA